MPSRASRSRPSTFKQLLSSLARAAVGGLALLLGPSWSMAAAPTLDQLYPAGGGVGTSNVLALAGKVEPWPPRIWVEGEGVTFSATTNKGRLAVEIDADATPGPRWVRLFNDEGASEPRMFVIGPAPELGDVEPNNAFTAAQPIETVPITINGRLDRNGDVDSFRVTPRRGEWIEARLDAYTLMSGLDAVIRLVTTNGHPIAWNHDGATLDPRVVWRATDAQPVVVQVFGFKYPADASIQLTGGEAAVYRLHLDVHAECPEAPIPLPSAGEESVSESPAVLSGVISGERKERRHRFRATKDELLEILLEAHAIGASWDAWMRIEDGAGKELAQNDDAEGTSDPRLVWRAPGDGEFAVVVGSRTRKGSPSHRYVLTLRRATPDFRVTMPVSSWSLTAGTTNEVKVVIHRQHGFSQDLRLAFVDLPEGVAAEAVTTTNGMGEASLLLVGATHAPASSGPVRVRIECPVLAEPRYAVHDLVSRGENNGVPQGYSRLLRDSIDVPWLTVRPALAPAAEK